MWVGVRESGRRLRQRCPGACLCRHKADTWVMMGGGARWHNRKGTAGAQGLHRDVQHGFNHYGRNHYNNTIYGTLQYNIARTTSPLRYLPSVHASGPWGHLARCSIADPAFPHSVYAAAPTRCRGRGPAGRSLFLCCGRSLPTTASPTPSAGRSALTSSRRYVTARLGTEGEAGFSGLAVPCGVRRRQSVFFSR